MRWLKPFLLFPVLALSLPDNVNAQDVLALNQTYTNAIRISSSSVGKTQIPLPPGTWKIMGLDSFRMGLSNILISIVYLANIEDGVLRASLSIRYNLDPPASKWRASSFCNRSNIHHIKVKSNSSGNVDCWGIRHVKYKPVKKANTAYKNMHKRLRRENISIPRTAIQVRFDRREGAKALILKYYFNPEVGGRHAPKGSRYWHPDKVRSDPEKADYIERLKVWGKSWKSIIDAGFEGNLQLPVGASFEPVFKKAINETASPTRRPSPPKAVPSKGQHTIAARLRRLRNLLSEGLITDAEYADKRNQILKEL